MLFWKKWHIIFRVQLAHGRACLCERKNGRVYVNIFVALNRLRFPLALPSEHLGRQFKLPPGWNQLELKSNRCYRRCTCQQTWGSELFEPTERKSVMTEEHMALSALVFPCALRSAHLLHTHVGLVPNPLSERSKHLQPRIRDAQMFRSVCPYCAVGCGLRVYVKDGKVIDIEGDPDSPVSGGCLCPKGSASFELVVNPQRWTTVKYRAPYATDYEAALRPLYAGGGRADLRDPAGSLLQDCRHAGQELRS